MNEKKTSKITAKQKEFFLKHLLPYIQACPHIVASGLGAEAFVEELNEAAIQYAMFPSEIVGSIKDLQPFITSCPQIFQHGIGIAAFTDELKKAAEKYILLKN